MADVTNFMLGNIQVWIKDVDARTAIESLTERLNTITPEENPPYIMVGKSGFKYTTIGDAVNAAKEYCTPTNRVCIIVNEGSYSESVRLWPNPGIDIIGLGQVDIYTAQAYPDAALYTCGAGIFVNLRFHITQNINSYAMHYEVAGTSGWQQGSTYFIDCIFDGEAGCGLGNGLNLYFVHCNFMGGMGASNVALYAHNYAGNDMDSAMSLVVKDCEFTGTGIALRLDDAATILKSGRTSVMYINLLHNWLNSNFTHSLLYYGTDYQNPINYLPASAPMLHFNNSEGNTAINWNMSDFTLNEMAGIHARVSDNMNFFLFPCPWDCRDFTITYGTLTVQGVGVVDNPSRTGGVPDFRMGAQSTQQFTGTGEYCTVENVHFIPQWTTL